MPEFSNPFTVLKNDRKLTHEELVRAIRFMIAAEYEAIQPSMTFTGYEYTGGFRAGHDFSGPMDGMPNPVWPMHSGN
jgi:hypothetical protein